MVPELFCPIALPHLVFSVCHLIAASSQNHAHLCPPALIHVLSAASRLSFMPSYQVMLRCFSRPVPVYLCFVLAFYGIHHV